MTKELLALYGARHAVLLMIEKGNCSFGKKLDDGTWKTINYVDICNYLTDKINESEENKMTKEQLEYATKINHDINMLEEQFDIDKFIAENIAEKLGELQRQFESL